MTICEWKGSGLVVGLGYERSSNELGGHEW